MNKASRYAKALEDADALCPDDFWISTTVVASVGHDGSLLLTDFTLTDSDARRLLLWLQGAYGDDQIAEQLAKKGEV